MMIIIYLVALSLGHWSTWIATEAIQYKKIKYIQIENRLTDNSHPRIDDSSGWGRRGDGSWRHLLSGSRIHRHRKCCTAVDVRGSIGRQEPRTRCSRTSMAVVVPLQAAAHVARHRISVRWRHRPKINFRWCTSAADVARQVGNRLHRVEVVERIR